MLKLCVDVEVVCVCVDVEVVCLNRLSVLKKDYVCLSVFCFGECTVRWSVVCLSDDQIRHIMVLANVATVAGFGVAHCSDHF